MKRWMGWVLVMVLVLSAAACAARQQAPMESGAMEPQGEEVMPMAAPAVELESSALRVENGAPTDAVLAEDDLPDRMIIYNGSLAMVVADPLATERDITAMVEKWGGYIGSTSSYAVGDGLVRIEMNLRVPAERFNEAMNQLRTLSDDIRQDSVSSSDVTEEYVDLESRLRALEAKAERLEELMEEAEDTEAVLSVYRELSATQQEIERVKGRMRYLERRAAMATIDVTLLPKEAEKPIEIGGWEAKGVAKKAIQALIDTYHALATFLIWLVLYILPVGLVVGGAFYGLYRLCRRFICRKRKDAGAPTA